MQIVRKYLSADEVSPPGLRYDPDCDCVQVSPDGGTTWTDDPGADPRHNPAYLLPARGGGSARCDSAESAMQHFKAQVDAFITGGTILGVVNLWVALLFFIPGVNVLIALILSVAEALFDTGVVVIDAAMTEPVYDQIKCIIYCNMDDDGQVSAEQFADIDSDVNSLIGGVPATVWSLITSAWGEVGLSNAGASGEYTGDCDACECGWCYEWDESAIEAEWTFDFGSTNGGYYVDTHIAFGSTLRVTEAFMIVCVDVTASGQQQQWWTVNYSGSITTQNISAGCDNELAMSGVPRDLAGVAISLAPGAGITTGSIRVTYIRLRGEGAEWNGASTCDI